MMEKNYAILRHPKIFQNIKTIQKSKTNNLFSLDKEEYLRKIWEPKKIKKFYNKDNFIEKENYKQRINIHFDSPLKNIKSNKEFNEWFNYKEKTGKAKKIIFDSISVLQNYNSSIDSLLNSENSKNLFGNKKIRWDKKFNLQHLKIRNKSDNNFGNIIERISKEEKKSKMFIKSFFENLVELSISFEFYNKFIPLANKLNETFFFLFDIKSFPINPFNIKFLEIYKISGILDISLIFLAKDKNLYKENKLKMKELLQKYIYFSINSINFKILESTKINNFLSINNLTKEITSLVDILNEIIILLFSNKINEYKKLNKCLRQLINNINSQTPKQILSIINDSILFCHNCVHINNKIKNFDKNKINTINKFPEDDNEFKPPYIKNKMTKKFCLILDLDETLIHNMNLPFGEYFLVRPGIFDLLSNVGDIFEIIIFTAAKREYAYNIIEKIDYKNFIDHILYKKHMINIEGNYVKKLDLIGRDLNKIIYVDNLEKNAKFNKKNLYLIPSWYNDIFDKEIYKLKEKLMYISTCSKFDNDISQGLYQK